MTSSARIDSAVFQLTPTRTRFDLVITAKGKTERIASGLLDPFLTHLKSAQEQINKGGYSIILEPRRGSNAPWFTKGIVERFVRFVSTPEILERVYTIESEISQIEEAISFQSNNDKELHGQVHDHKVKHKDNGEATPKKTCTDTVKSGSKGALGCNEDKSIVLYKPGTLALETGDFNVHGQNPKGARVYLIRNQLLRVLETRRSMLQKEQGMAFARAVAAGFDIDHIAPLASFAECFGAARMMEACSRFMEMWKAKHKNGQWVEIEVVEDVCRADLASMAAFSVPNANGKQTEGKELVLQGELPSENSATSTTARNADPKPPMDNQGRFPHHPTCPPWSVHQQAGQMPLYSPYSMPVPYYQNYPGNGTFFQPVYSSVDGMEKVVRERNHSMDAGDVDPESDREEDYQSRERKKKSGKSAKKQSGTVVIRNINYIASKRQNSSDSGSQSYSDNDDYDGNETVNATPSSVKNKNIQRSSKQGKQGDKEDIISGHAGDDGHWQTFQNLLLQGADADDISGKSSMFASEGKVPGRKRQVSVGNDPSVLGGRQKGGEVNSHHDISADMMRSMRPSRGRILIDGGANLGQSNVTMDNHFGVPFAEMEGEGAVYRQIATASDESFIVPCRPNSIDRFGDDSRMAVDIDSELPLTLTSSQNPNGKTGGDYSYEPYDLNMMPNRVTENGAANHDAALDYELQAARVDSKKKSADVKQGTKKVGSVKGPRTQKTPTAITKAGKPSKLSPSEEARVRAERLRSYKADLQKQKKAKEEEQAKRLEALKIERQKRIAARSSGGKPASPVLSPPSKKLQPARLSPVSCKGSKFSDTEPGSSSPLQRSTVKTMARLSRDGQNSIRPARLNFGSPTSGNQLTRSASLNERKEENKGSTPDSKASTARIRRLSEPKGGVYPASSAASPSEKPLSRRTYRGSDTKRTLATVKSVPIKTTATSRSSIKVLKGHSEVTQKKRSMKEPTQRADSKSISNASASVAGSGERASFRSDHDENPVVEKNVVMLECDKPSPVVQEFGEKLQIQSLKPALDSTKGESPSSVAPRPQISTNGVEKTNAGSVDSQQTKVSPSNEAGAACIEKILPNAPTVDTAEMPYKAPYARVSSLEHPCTEKSEYAKALPSSIMASTGSELISAHIPSTISVDVSNSKQQKLDKVWELSEKLPEKEPSKGFKRLLKFGKKKQSSGAGESNKESEIANHSISASSSSEATTLRNLLSQGENSSAHQTTPQKSSRSFSLLSQFRMKGNEKKPSTWT